MNQTEEGKGWDWPHLSLLEDQIGREPYKVLGVKDKDEEWLNTQCPAGQARTYTLTGINQSHLTKRLHRVLTEFLPC